MGYYEDAEGASQVVLTRKRPANMVGIIYDNAKMFMYIMGCNVWCYKRSLCLKMVKRACLQWDINFGVINVAYI